MRSDASLLIARQPVDPARLWTGTADAGLGTVAGQNSPENGLIFEKPSAAMAA
jgi:hypothetical protein